MTNIENISSNYAGERIAYKALVVLTWLSICFFVPPMYMVIFKQSSLSTGVFLVAILFQLSFLKYKILNYRYLTISAVILVFALISSFTSADEKPILSALVFLFVYSSYIQFVEYIRSLDDRVLKRAITILYYILIVIGVIGFTLKLRFLEYSDKNYPVFPFAEPSHFALAFAPIAICFQMMNSRNTFVVIRTIGVTFLLGCFYPNLTLIIISIFQFFLLKRRILVPVLLTIICAVFFYLLYSDAGGYFYDRIVYDPANLNLSNLVYLQGWEAAWIALKETYLFGVGFQQNGTQSPGYFTDLISYINRDELNRSDGGFLASKLISEFGVLGIGIIVLFSFLTFRGYRADLYNDSKVSVLFYYALSISLFIELFVRGYGYFSPTLILLLSFISINKVKR